MNRETNKRACGRKPCWRKSIALLAAVAAAATPGPASAAITVFLDYTNFEVRLSELALAASVNPFTLAEQAEIQNAVQLRAQSIYAGFDITFTQTAPAIGDYERILFGLTTASTGIFGLADGLDYRNFRPNDVGRVYTRNFATFIDEFDGGENRPEQIRQLTTALAGTTAHELGHNLGLQHYDCYCHPDVTPANYANTGGTQNTHIMATGGTGLNETQRENNRTFSQLETAKLEFANGLTAAPPASILSQNGIATLATAQTINFSLLPLSGLNAANIIGGLGVAGEFDYYRFFGNANELFTANILSNSITYRNANPINSVLTLFDENGGVLASNNDIAFSGNVFNSFGTYNQDSILLNRTLPASGNYFVRVSALSAADTGGYELFMSTFKANAIPEPATSQLAAWGLLGALLLKGKQCGQPERARNRRRPRR